MINPEAVIALIFTVIVMSYAIACLIYDIL